MSEYVAPAVKEYAKDGAWIVPKDERPRGWESMGLREVDAIACAEPVVLPAPVYEFHQRVDGKWDWLLQKAAAADVDELIRVTLDPGADVNQYRVGAGASLRSSKLTSRWIWSIMLDRHALLISKKSLRVADEPGDDTDVFHAVFGEEREKWKPIKDRVMALKTGESVRIVPPADQAPDLFRSRIGAALASGRPTSMVHWHSSVVSGAVVVRRGENHEPPLFRREPKPATVAVAERSTEVTETTSKKTTVVERVSMESNKEEHTQPAPEESSTIHSVEPIEHALPSPVVVPPSRQSCTAEENRIIDMALQLWNPYDSECGDAWQELFESMEQVAWNVRAQREALAEADRLIEHISADSQISQGTRNQIWERFRDMAAQRRLLEFNLAYAAFLIRRRGDPCQADEFEELLPESDRARIQKLREKEPSS